MPWGPWRPPLRDWRPSLRCETGKLRFSTKAEAQVALDRTTALAAAGDERRHEQAMYVCPKCLGWHLTSKRQRVL